MIHIIKWLHKVLFFFKYYSDMEKRKEHNDIKHNDKKERSTMT